MLLKYYPSPDIFSSNLDETKNFSGRELREGTCPSISVPVSFVYGVFKYIFELENLKLKTTGNKTKGGVT